MLMSDIYVLRHDCPELCRTSVLAKCISLHMVPLHNTTVYLFTDRQRDMTTSVCLLPHFGVWRPETQVWGLGHLKFIKTCLGHWRCVVPNFMPFGEVPAEKTVTGPKTNSKLSIPPILHVKGYTHTHTHTCTHTQPFYGSLDFVRDNPGEPVPEETFTHSHSSWSSIISICFLHLLRSMTSSLFNPRALQFFSTISLQFFGLPLGLSPSTSYSIHFFTQSLSSFCNTCPHIATCFAVVTRLCHLILVSLSTLLGTLSCNFTPHIHLTILVSALSLSMIYP